MNVIMMDANVIATAQRQDPVQPFFAARDLHAYYGESYIVQGVSFVANYRGQFDRKSAGLPHTTLHVVGARAQMRMAGVEIAPGIDDADDRLAFPVGLVVAELPQPRAVTERTQIADTEPAVAAEIFRPFLAHV